MHGNVMEWCSDWYGPYAEGATKDLTGPATGELRVVRDGCWMVASRGCRAARRDHLMPAARFEYLGFRVLVVVSYQTP